MSVITWAKEHPAPAAGVAVVGVLVIMFLFRGSGSGGASNSGAVQAYYAAVAQQGQAGAQIQVAQIQANAATAQSLIANSYGLETNKVWEENSSQISASNNAAAVEVARQQASTTIETERQKAYVALGGQSAFSNTLPQLPANDRAGFAEAYFSGH